jgi:hypothetical protein
MWLLDAATFLPVVAMHCSLFLGSLVLHDFFIIAVYEVASCPPLIFIKIFELSDAMQLSIKN